MKERRPGPTGRVHVAEYDAGPAPSRHEDRVLTEEPLEIRLGWPGAPARRVWTTLRTPGNDFELAAGWVHHEGLGSASGVAYCTDRDLTPEQEFNVVTVTLLAAPPRLPTQLDALSAGSSACGVCGTDSVSEVLARRPAAAWDGALPSPAVVRSLPGLMRPHQELFARTGSAHAAGLFTADGELLVCREDVGRHNAVDKAVGSRLLHGDPPSAAALVVSGRAGFELAQKAVASGVGALVAVGAPTGLSARLASEAGLALFGWTSDGRTVRYA
ncbi:MULTISPECIES: formate dehydrogenase accessory sulfurtransferase FdhD [Nocardioides]|uniref:Formate dehydrogenase accessory sulfurtransferase FdhD n=1 Tax=Nocardioides vastitatis TaxID=2568655 RepID=A0ABW0ZIY4_9ACTN|nr:formate dehydrogenase accessory sulfurtransferase FdhD [Nocardioides sp.]THI96633.1 sulfurtransferase FdhD [Nocardioides sp.]